jgi:hypothetical protein
VRSKEYAIWQTAGSQSKTMGITTQNSKAKPATRRVAPPKGVNWSRFWMQMLIAVLVFNLIAGLVTWFFIFPKLHPGM